MNTNIIYRGVLLNVDCTITGGQKEIIRADPNDSQEGIDPEICIDSVTVGGEEIGPLFDDDMEEELHCLIIKKLGVDQ